MMCIPRLTTTARVDIHSVSIVIKYLFQHPKHDVKSVRHQVKISACLRNPSQSSQAMRSICGVIPLCFPNCNGLKGRVSIATTKEKVTPNNLPSWSY